MTIESATYINGLNASYPGASDVKSEGDDHIRLLKSTVKASFPNISGACTPTHTVINNLAAGTFPTVAVTGVTDFSMKGKQSIIRSADTGQHIDTECVSGGHLVTMYSRTDNAKGLTLNVTTDTSDPTPTVGTAKIELQTYGVTKIAIQDDDSITLGVSSLATTATAGFVYVPSCAGTPTGAPTSYGSRVPIVVDRSNNRLYFYSNAAWRNAGP